MSKRFITICLSLIIFTTFIAVYFISVSFKPVDNGPRYELLEITDCEIFGTERSIKVVRLLQINKDFVQVKEIDCYTEFGVNQVIWGLVK